MNGPGVTNYDASEPSYGFSATTTQFDDELIRRGIVTKEQALMAKGMTLEQARELLRSSGQTETMEPKVELDEDEDEEDFLEEEDDEFMKEYREKRLASMMQPKNEPRMIDRTEWVRYVNEASHRQWVVVCLTSSDTERTGVVETSVRKVAETTPTVSFVMIPAHSAIANWPVANLPSLFLYRDGKMQHELVRLRADLSPEDLRGILHQVGAMTRDESSGSSPFPNVPRPNEE